MKTVMIYASIHHGNTRKVVEAMAKELSADTIDITKNANPDISGYDMVRLIRLLQTYTGKTAVVGFSAIIKSIYVLCDLLQYEIDCFEINSENELFPMLSSLQSQGKS